MKAGDERRHVERVTWCMTTGGYADESACADPKRHGVKVDHDHYDLAVDITTGEAMWRIDPVGTVYLMPHGGVLRVSQYKANLVAEPAIEDTLYPQYDRWSPTGGASSIAASQVIDEVWKGATLRPGVTRIVPVAYRRPAPGSLFVRPNGEAWRLTGYGTDYKAEPSTGDKTKPTYSVLLPRGRMTNGGHDLPEDARLVWAP